jgi:hypothetical protein
MIPNTEYTQYLEDEIERVRAAFGEAEELHRMQLAAISNCTTNNTKASLKYNIDSRNKYWTPAYQQVLRLIDREIALLDEKRRTDEYFIKMEEMLKKYDSNTTKLIKSISGKPPRNGYDCSPTTSSA